MLNLFSDSFDKSSARSFCKTYTFRRKEKPNLGSLLLILEIAANPKEGKKIAEILSEILDHEYFKKDSGVEKNFEYALNRANQAMATLAESGHIEWLNKLHAVICAIYDNQIHLSSCGEAHTALLRGDDVINIIDASKATTHGPMKTFANIISGTLRRDDKLFFATNKVLEYFSQDKIKRVIKKSSPREAKQIFLIDAAHDFEPMAMIFAEIKEKDAAIPKPNETSKITYQRPAISTPRPAMRPFPPINTIRSQTQTSKFDFNKIKAVIVKNIKNAYNSTASIFNRTKSQPKSLSNSPFNKGREPQSLSNSPFNKGREPQLTTSAPARPMLTQFKKPEVRPTFKTPVKKDNAIFGTIKNYFSFILSKFNKLPPISRTLLFVALIFILAFTVSVSRNSSKKTTTKTSTKVEESLKLAQEKEKTASNNLIYGDFNGARPLLLEAKKLVENDVLASKKYKTDGEALLTKIQEDLDKTDKVVRVKEPQILADLEADKINTAEILGIENNIYIFDRTKNNVYKLNEGTKQLAQKNETAGNIGKVALATANDTKNSLLFLTEKPDLFEFDLESNEFKDLDTAFAGTPKPKDMKLYMDRLYVLDSAVNQIFRHVRTITGYSKGSEWFEDAKNLNIKDAVSFAIDGSVYILKSNGQILKFLNAEKEDFAVPQMATPLSAPIKIFTLTDYESVYILEPAQKRVVVLDKKGAYKNQYVSDKFSEAKDIYVNEKDKKIYVLTENKILEVALEK